MTSSSSTQAYTVLIGLYYTDTAIEVPNDLNPVGTIVVLNNSIQADDITVTHDPTDWNLSAGGLYGIRGRLPMLHKTQ